MSEPGDASQPTDLTGYWSGEYWYDAGMGTLAQFAAHISDAGNAFDGTTLESVNYGAGLKELTASISGARDSANVEFIKRYDAGQRIHRLPIFYAGILNADLTQIDGLWTLKELFFRMNGGFRMQRGSQGAKAAVTRKAKAPEPVGGNKQPDRCGEGSRKISCVRSLCGRIAFRVEANTIAPSDVAGQGLSRPCPAAALLRSSPHRRAAPSSRANASRPSASSSTRPAPIHRHPRPAAGAGSSLSDRAPASVALQTPPRRARPPP